MLGKSIIAVLVFIPGVTIAIGMGVDPMAPDKIFSDNPTFDAKEQTSVVLAQNDKHSPEDSEKAESGSETDKSDGTASDEKKSSEAESKPLKPFVPSEQIAGEQAVDFPADI